MNFERIKKNVSRYYHYILTLEISGKSIWPSLRNSPDKKGEENKKKEKKPLQPLYGLLGNGRPLYA